MNFFTRYKNYLKDNPQNYWFKRKLYGWGWTPVKWQGWLVLLAYVALLVVLVFLRTKEVDIPGDPDSGSNFLVFAGPVIILTALLIIVCYKKGEKPRWQWGVPKDNQNQIQK